MINTHNLFPSAVFAHEVKKFNKSKLAEYIYSEKRKDPEGLRNSNFGGWQSKAHYHLTDNPIVETIGRSLVNLRILKPNVVLRLDGLWFNVNPPGSHNMMHQHPNCDLAAVMWIHAPKNSGNLVFENPHAFAHNKMNMYDNEVQKRAIQYTAYNFSPREGMILLFPSYLRHAVEVNQCQDDRVSISFNAHMEYKK